MRYENLKLISHILLSSFNIFYQSISSHDKPVHHVTQVPSTPSHDITCKEW